MVSLFIMDFAPGGTNIPHHHEMEEEIYYVLRGKGEMVAGGGADGNEGRYPAKEGDAYFIRLNTTVGFYSGSREGEPHDLILAVRSTLPVSKNEPVGVRAKPAMWEDSMPSVLCFHSGGRPNGRIRRCWR